MATILTSEIISQAMGVIETYKSNVDAANNNLKNMIETLRQDGFIGDGSDGYEVFFTDKVTPAIKDNLYGEASLMKMLTDILQGISDSLLDTVDPQIGDKNKELSSSAFE